MWDAHRPAGPSEGCPGVLVSWCPGVARPPTRPPPPRARPLRLEERNNSRSRDSPRRCGEPLAASSPALLRELKRFVEGVRRSSSPRVCWRWKFCPLQHSCTSRDWHGVTRHPGFSSAVEMTDWTQPWRRKFLNNVTGVAAAARVVEGHHALSSPTYAPRLEGEHTVRSCTAGPRALLVTKQSGAADNLLRREACMIFRETHQRGWPVVSASVGATAGIPRHGS
jgi:hypothetical protein